jgi:hypothetical protein
VTLSALLASGVVGGTSIALWYFGQKFSRRYIALNGVLPPLTWMFRRAADPELETFRRRALAFVPFYLVAVAIVLFQP